MTLAHDAGLDGPLASVGLSALHRPAGTAPRETAEGGTAVPLALRKLEPAPGRELPDYRYDAVRQIAVTPDGRPIGPLLAKRWTSYESTHTDGDGGDNETWGWEE